MKLADMTVTQFVDTVASDAPAPGGGSVAALEGSIGAALTAMVGNLTQGRKKYADYAEYAAVVEGKGNELKARLLDVMDRDTEAFNVVSAAFGMPKATDAEKAARSAAIQEGLKGCTRTPMEMMELCADGIALAASLLERGFNDTSASDLGVAFLSLKSGLQGAWLNVLINIGSLKDRAFAEECRKQGEVLLQRALPLADAGFAKVVSMIEGE
ncbi:MAG: cyclodeaminase/cyclohydrolase family protein [Oscillospiraceae bacterium]|nr:cyclodeaminase/cyclohydrolase family protein [Oscillospiraceae bacterium]